ncbi:unnamed protein product [Adineta steineri]|uniref:Uncharacterized protein n=1 Tax=Adineta steineri TaxID=433720 RepID=A0A818JYC8_9BILA|nr:unnamed protein product [Adineta steineri]
MDAKPDLSHLTDDERKIIEAVINRQNAEEKLDAFNIPSPIDDYSLPSIAISSSSSSRRYSQSNESGVFCQICQKTKFVNEQSSRQCSICQKRFCVRCGIRLKSQYYVCNQCRQKQEHYFSSTKNICKQYLSDYILSQTSDENNQMNKQRILPKPEINNNKNYDEASPSDSNKNTRLLPQIKPNLRSMNILRDFQYHSLEDREIGHELTLKDSGIDTASSSTILNVISSEQFKKPMTYWRFNEAHTEQIGYIYLKNTLPTHGKIYKEDIFKVLGLQIQNSIRYENEYMAEITKVIPGSIADTYGQLRIGDQILEWNGEKLTNDINQIFSHIPKHSPQIHMIVKRLIRNPIESNNDHLISNRIFQEDKTISSTIETNYIQLQFSYRYDENCLHVMIYGARHIPIRQGLVACQLSLQYDRDISSTEEKCTKAQPCSSGICTWNQHITFFDIETLDNILLWIKLINLEHNQEILGEIKFNKLYSNSKTEWYNLNNNISNGLPFNRVLPPPTTTDIPSTANTRKRQLPDIPTAQLEANREKVSQDLFQKAAELKLRLHMQSKNEKSLIMQRSFDHTELVSKPTYEDRTQSIDDNSRKSRISLLSPSSKMSSTNTSREKLRIPMIRDKSVPNSILTRRTSLIEQNGNTTTTNNNIEKSKSKSFEEKYRKTIKKRYSSETQAEDVDSDGSELSSGSRMSSASILSTQSERPRYLRKHNIPKNVNEQFYHSDEIQLNEKELRQMAMRTNDTIINSTINNPTAIETSVPSTSIVNGKISKLDQRNDGTVSDSALSSQSETNKKRQPSMSSKALVILGLSKKANSSSNLGCAKRYGFQRSEEIGVQPHLRSRALQQQTSKENETPSSAPPMVSTKSLFAGASPQNQSQSMPNDMIKLWSGALKLPHEHQFTEFIEGLGKGQLVGRQVLASPCHGEIQIGIRNQNSYLEVEIVRARNLIQKPYYKMPPAPYVKVYLLDGKTCIEKQRTRTTTRRTLDPLIQQALLFKETFRDRVLQISIWGDYGKLDRKVFMGVCQIGLDEINLNTSQQTLSWYKLFSSNSLMNNYTIVQQSKRKNTIS